MHNYLIATFDKEKSRDSLEARDYLLKFLGKKMSNYTFDVVHDAMILDEKSYNQQLSCYEGKNEYWRECLMHDPSNFLDLDEDNVAPTFIGKKWIVILDCNFRH